MDKRSPWRKVFKATEQANRARFSGCMKPAAQEKRIGALGCKVGASQALLALSPENTKRAQKEVRAHFLFSSLTNLSKMHTFWSNVVIIVAFGGSLQISARPLTASSAG